MYHSVSSHGHSVPHTLSYQILQKLYSCCAGVYPWLQTHFLHSAAVSNLAFSPVFHLPTSSSLPILPSSALPPCVSSLVTYSSDPLLLYKTYHMCSHEPTCGISWNYIDFMLPQWFSLVACKVSVACYVFHSPPPHCSVVHYPYTCLPLSTLWLLFWLWLFSILPYLIHDHLVVHLEGVTLYTWPHLPLTGSAEISL